MMHKIFALLNSDFVANNIITVEDEEGLHAESELKIKISEFDLSILGKKFTGLDDNSVPVFVDVESKFQAIRKITKRAFMQRFTQSERIAIRKSVDDIVIDIHEDLKATNSVDLDMSDTAQALGYLVAVGILTSDRPAEILVDGVAGEV